MFNGLPILVVEDDEDVLDSIREVLEEAGFRVTTARDGAEALALLSRMPRPTTMLVDSMMGTMSGPAFISACGAVPDLAGIPAVLISGHHHDELELPNVRGFLLKPFTGDELLEAVARAVGAQPPPTQG
jgi:CheY-like chemotaxis protein